MKRRVFQVAVVLLVTLACLARGAKHVIFMHGIFGSASQINYINSMIQKAYPGTNTTSIAAFEDALSIEPMWTQINAITEQVSTIMANNPNGVNLICYSQGGLICRGLVSVLRHNVDTFIALSSPLAGQFGDTEITKHQFPAYLKENLYRLLYTPYGQMFSIGNYWNDPHHQDLYRKYVRLIPILNNEVTTPRSPEIKENFLRLKKLVLIGGPDDEIITPWQSSHFGFYDSTEVVQDMEQQQWYKADSFGLKTLVETNRVIQYTVPGIKHLQWISNPAVVNKYILPHLS